MKEIKDMRKKELIDELEAVEQQINMTSYGKFELYHRENILREIDKRGLELLEHTSFSFAE